MSECGGQVYDKHGIPIMPGDTLKVFHYTGARRQKIYMYKHVLHLNASGRALEVSHLGTDGQSYWLAIDGRIHAEIEIVQGYGGVKLGQSFRDRKKGGGGE